MTIIKKKMGRALAMLLTMMMLLGTMMVPAFATDLTFVTNGGQGYYFAGSTFMMKGKVANEGISVPGASALVEVEIAGNNVFRAVVETDASGCFTTGFNLPRNVSKDDVMDININGVTKKSFTLTDYDTVVGADASKALELLGSTISCTETSGAETATVPLSPSIGIAFSKNVNYFANNNASDEDLVYMGTNERNADSVSLYKGSSKVDINVNLIAEGGTNSVSFNSLSGAAGNTQARNIIYISPKASLTADTEYKIVIESEMTGNNNIWLNETKTLYFKTAAAPAGGGTPGGGAAGGGGGGGGASGGGGGGGGGTAAETATPGAVTETPTETPAETPAENQTGTPNENAGSTPENTAVDTFTDVTADAWFAADVDYVYEKGYFKGTSDSTFEPFTSTSRAMITTVLGRLSGETVTGYSNSFADVKAGSWYADSVSWAASKGLVKGFSSVEFGPEKNITREQLAEMLYNYNVYKYGEGKTADISGFSDSASVSSWAQHSVQWAYAEGILNGSDGKILPQDEATRAQVAAMIHRFVTSR